MSRERIAQRLAFIYGDGIADRTFIEVERLLDRFRARSPHRGAVRRGFDERDTILITYGDSFLDPPGPPLAALRRFATAHLRDLVSTIHILPFFPYSSDYGFSVIDFLQVNPDLGDWDDVEALRAEFKLMFDFVLNHVSSESAWFRAFLRGEEPYDRFFITADPHTDLSGVTRPRTTPLLTPFQTAGGERHVWTTFSADQVDVNWADPRAMLAMLEVMLTYVERGADLLRMDAVGYLWKEVGTSCIHLPQTHQMVKLFRDVLDEVAPHVAIVTETNVPHEDNISYFGDGADEAQMVYQFPLAPLVLDALARGDAGHLTRWAATLAAPSDQTTFFNFLASHDGVGVVPARGILSDADVANLADRVRAHGGEVSYKTNPDGSESPYELNATWFDALSDPNDGAEPWARKLDRFICSQAIMLALAGVPGIYVHSLFGSHNDHAAYARTGWKRDLNHERLELRELERRLADPSTEAAQVFGRYAHALQTRRTQPAFHPVAAQRVLAAHPAVFAVQRGPRDGQTILALHNVSAAEQAIDLASVDDRPGVRDYRDAISGRAVPAGSPIRLAPYEFLWLL
jgi:sucrose phosphorylase